MRGAESEKSKYFQDENCVLRHYSDTWSERCLEREEMLLDPVKNRDMFFDLVVNSDMFFYPRDQ